MARDEQFKVDYGTDSPEADAQPQTYDDGNLRECTAPGSPIIRWRKTGAGANSDHPGAWEPLYGGIGGHGLERRASIAQLAAIDCSGYTSTQTHLCEVTSVGDFFKHSPTGGLGTWSSATAYAVGDIVFSAGKSWVSIQAGTNHTPASSPTFWTMDMERIASAAGTSLWHRMGIPNPAWQQQSFWALSSAGDDENAGCGVNQAAADAVPLATTQELARRTKGTEVDGRAVVIKRLTSSTTADRCNMDMRTTSTGAIYVIGDLGSAVFSGTISSPQTAVIGNANAGGLDYRFTDSSIPTSFTASGLLANSVIFKRTNSTECWWWAAKDLTSKTLRISIPKAEPTSLVATIAGTGAQVAVSASDTYAAYGLLDCHEMRFPPGTRVVFQHLAILDLDRNTHAIYRLCAFISSTQIQDNKQHRNCAFMASFSSSSQAVSAPTGGLIRSTASFSLPRNALMSEAICSQGAPMTGGPGGFQQINMGFFDVGNTLFEHGVISLRTNTIVMIESLFGMGCTADYFIALTRRASISYRQDEGGVVGVNALNEPGQEDIMDDPAKWLVHCWGANTNVTRDLDILTECPFSLADLDVSVLPF